MRSSFAGAAVVVLALLSASAVAHARPENDVQPIDPANGLPDVDSNGYKHLMSEFGLLISSKTLAPSSTLGANGFDMGFEMDTGLLHGGSPYWKAATKDGSQPSVFPYPVLRVRKGLPFSLEGGMSVGYLPFTGEQVLGGQGRFALHEGFELVPDVAFMVSYDKLVGNEQFDMSDTQATLTIGYTWPFGNIPGLKTGRVSVWGGYGKIAIDTTLNGRYILAAGANPAVSFAGVGANSSGFREFRWDKWIAGVQVESGHFSYLLDTEGVDKAVPTFNMRVGATF